MQAPHPENSNPLPENGTDTGSGPGLHGPLWSPVVLILIGLCCVIELTLTAADYGLIGSPLWRPLAYQNGAFWAGLLYNWRPNYAAQPVLMFFTYAFLHAGPGHLAGNMLTLLFLGDIVEHQAGRRGLIVIYVVSALGGAAAFGLLNAAPQPMVGASGALFGLAGAWQAREWSNRRQRGQSLWPVWRTIAGFAVLNLLLWWAMGGQLAWETHLGGFIAGWTAAAVLIALQRRNCRARRDGY